MLFIHGRLANKDLARTFQMWSSASMNGNWKAVAAAKRKRTVLHQKLSIAQSHSVGDDQRLRDIRKLIQAEDMNIQKQEAMLLEQERQEQIDRRASGNNTIRQEDKIETVFETRAAKKQRMGSVLNRLTKRTLIQVRRGLSCVHHLTFVACTFAHDIWCVK